MSKIILFPFWPSPKGLFVLFSVSHYFHRYRLFLVLSHRFTQIFADFFPDTSEMKSELVCENLCETL